MVVECVMCFHHRGAIIVSLCVIGNSFEALLTNHPKKQSLQTLIQLSSLALCIAIEDKTRAAKETVCVCRTKHINRLIRVDFVVPRHQSVKSHDTNGKFSKRGVL